MAQLSPDDGFPKKMFRFRREAEERIAALKDLLRLADSTYNQALVFYGEDAKSIASTDEFFSVFKTFVTSYRSAREDNRRAEDARRKAAEAAVRDSVFPLLDAANEFLTALGVLGVHRPAKPKLLRLPPRRSRRATRWSKT